MQENVTNQNNGSSERSKGNAKTTGTVSNEISTLRQQIAHTNGTIATWNANAVLREEADALLKHKPNRCSTDLRDALHWTKLLWNRRDEAYDTKYPNGNARGGTDVIIGQNIMHYELEKFDLDLMRATTIKIEDWWYSSCISGILSLCVTKYIRKYLRITPNLYAQGLSLEEIITPNTPSSGRDCLSQGITLCKHSYEKELSTTSPLESQLTGQLIRRKSQPA